MRHLIILIFSICLFLTACKTTNVDKKINEKPQEEIVENVENEVKLNEFGMPILLEYMPTFIDLGKVKRGEKRNLEFEYKNVSNEEVGIEIVTACSCTETDFTVSTMQPGESGKIVLVFDSTTKEKSETIDVDIILKNTEPKNGYPIVDRVQFKYELLPGDE